MSSAKWCKPLYIIALLRSLMDSMNSTLKPGIEGRVLISGGGGRVGGKVNKWRGGSNKWGMKNRYEEAFFSEIRIISLQERAFIKDLASVDK